MATSQNQQPKKRRLDYSLFLFSLFLVLLFAIYPIAMYTAGCTQYGVKSEIIPINGSFANNCRIALTSHSIGLAIGIGIKLFAVIKMIRTNQKVKSSVNDVSLKNNPEFWFKTVLFIGGIILLNILRNLGYTLFPAPTTFLFKLAGGVLGGALLMALIFRILDAINIVNLYEN